MNKKITLTAIIVAAAPSGSNLSVMDTLSTVLQTLVSIARGGGHVRGYVGAGRAYASIPRTIGATRVP